MNAFIGWLVLAAGDCASTIVGRRCSVHRFRSGRSVGGFLGFAVAATLVTWLGLAWWTGSLSPTSTVVLAGISLVCGLAELTVTGIDDNYYLPGLAAGIFSLAAVA